jgi:hypothetical protein
LAGRRRALQVHLRIIHVPDGTLHKLYSRVDFDLQLFRVFVNVTTGVIVDAGRKQSDEMRDKEGGGR